MAEGDQTREIPTYDLERFRGEPARRAKVGRPDKTEAFRGLAQELLAANPDLATSELLRRAREAGYGGGKSAFYAMTASVRPRWGRTLGEGDVLPGQASDHDLGTVTAMFADGLRRRVSFLVSRLRYSQWTAVTLLGDRTVEDLGRALVGHFAGMGGVPLLLTLGSPCGVAYPVDGGVQWDPAFACLAAELGVGVELAPQAGRRRRQGEPALARWATEGFFRGRVFSCLSGLASTMAAWTQAANLTGLVASRIDIERARLRPIRASAETLVFRVPVCVGRGGVVTYDGQTYWLPAEATGTLGTIFVHKDRVRIVAGSFSAAYARGNRG